MAPNLPAKPRAGRMITALGAATGLSTAIYPQALSIVLVVTAVGTFLLVSVFAAALFGGTRLSSRAFRLIRLCRGSPAKLGQAESPRRSGRALARPGESGGLVYLGMRRVGTEGADRPGELARCPPG
jgi:hypothetical protein